MPSSESPELTEGASKVLDDAQPLAVPPSSNIGIDSSGDGDNSDGENSDNSSDRKGGVQFELELVNDRPSKCPHDEAGPSNHLSLADELTAMADSSVLWGHAEEDAVLDSNQPEANNNDDDGSSEVGADADADTDADADVSDGADFDADADADLAYEDGQYHHNHIDGLPPGLGGGGREYQKTKMVG